MSKDKKRLVPVRRFKEFENAPAWEQRKLGEVVERFDNLRIPVTSSKRKRGITPYYGANGIQDYVQGYTHDGEFVLVAEDGANDLQNYPVHYVNGKVWVNNHAHVLQGKKDIVDNLFLVNAIKRIKFETYLVGGSRAKLNADVMMKLPIKIPKLNEQQKLGKYFSRIDSLIALHQRKLDKLKRVKSAYLTEMFPAEGEREPKRRFPGFTVAWEQRKLGEVAEINPSSEIPDNFEYVDLESVVGTEMIAYRRENKKTAPSRAQRLAKKGDIFYQTVRPYQKNNYHFNLTRKDFVFSTGYAQLRPNINGDFLFVYIQLSNFVNEVLNRSTGTSYPAISPSNLIRMKVAIPTNNEQEKIGAFFKQLDSLIALHQRKLDKLKKMKAAYLEEMFV